MYINESYFNDKPNNVIDVNDINVIHNNHKYKYTVVINTDDDCDYSSENMTKCINGINMILDNSLFVTDHSEVTIVTPIADMVSKNIKFGKEWQYATYINIEFKINVVDNSQPNQILIFFKTLYKYLSKTSQKQPKDMIVTIGDDTKNKEYDVYRIETEDLLKLLSTHLNRQTTLTDTKLISSMISMIRIFKKKNQNIMTKTYNKLFSFFNISHSIYNDAIEKRIEYTLLKNSDNIASGFAEIDISQDIIDELKQTYILADTLNSPDNIFWTRIYEVQNKKNPLDTPHVMHTRVANYLKANPHTPNDIIIKRFDDDKNIMMYIFLGPIVFEDGTLIECALGCSKPKTHIPKICQEFEKLTKKPLIALKLMEIMKQ